ncbi:MAG: hypothetical protein ACRDSZ_21835 [Pseudonocardiaceae bacterium]
MPGSGRFIDPTVEQYPDVRDYGLGPICGRLAASLATPEQQARIARGELIPGTHIGVEREDLLLLYTTVGHEFDDVVMSGAPVIENLAEAQRSGRNLAAQCIAILCQSDVIERARQTPHPRVRTLLDLLAAAETTDDDAGDLRFILPGDSDRRGRRLDELGVPVLGPGLSTSAATTNGMPIQRAAQPAAASYPCRACSTSSIRTKRTQARRSDVGGACSACSGANVRASSVERRHSGRCRRPGRSCAPTTRTPRFHRADLAVTPAPLRHRLTDLRFADAPARRDGVTRCRARACRGGPAPAGPYDR